MGIILLTPTLEQTGQDHGEADSKATGISYQAGRGVKLFDGGGLYGRVWSQESQALLPLNIASSLRDIRKKRDVNRSWLSPVTDPVEKAKAEKLETQLEQAQQIEQQKQELERLATEAANRCTFSGAIEQWEKLELSWRKDGGKVALVDVKRARLVDILDSVVERGTRVMANHLRQFFDSAIAREWINAHPLVGLT